MSTTATTYSQYVSSQEISSKCTRHQSLLSNQRINEYRKKSSPCLADQLVALLKTGSACTRARLCTQTYTHTHREREREREREQGEGRQG